MDCARKRVSRMKEEEKEESDGLHRWAFEGAGGMGEGRRKRRREREGVEDGGGGEAEYKWRRGWQKKKRVRGPNFFFFLACVIGVDSGRRRCLWVGLADWVQASPPWLGCGKLYLHTNTLPTDNAPHTCTCSERPRRSVQAGLCPSGFFFLSLALFAFFFGSLAHGDHR